jgi:hypothetical protein
MRADWRFGVGVPGGLGLGFLAFLVDRPTVKAGAFRAMQAAIYLGALLQLGCMAAI